MANTQERDRVYKMLHLWACAGGTYRTGKRQLPAFAWPGGYPIVYYDGDTNTLCPDCATEALKTFLEDRKDAACQGHLYDYYSDLPQWRDIHYEGPSEICDECGAEIESAYGDPFADERDD